MRYAELGLTGLRVSQLCFGSLAVGPAQYGLARGDAENLIDYAWNLGVNFFDTAELYGTYPHLRRVAARDGAVIASRSYAYDAAGMKRSLDLARRELSRETVDVFGLHEQESGLTLKGHRSALEYLAEAREKGVVRAVSVSTHSVICVRAAAMLPEVDVIFAMLNMRGLGIRDGSREDMESALGFAAGTGKGIYIMKALGGGHLYREARRALQYARDFPHKSSVAVGLHTVGEVEFAAKIFSREEVSQDYEAGASMERHLVVEDWCEGCGECVKACGFGALSLSKGSVTVDKNRCMLCGYCARVCPHFCLKVM